MSGFLSCMMFYGQKGLFPAETAVSAEMMWHVSSEVVFFLLKIASHFTNWKIYKLLKKLKTFTTVQNKKQCLTDFLWRK